MFVIYIRLLKETVKSARYASEQDLATISTATSCVSQYLQLLLARHTSSIQCMTPPTMSEFIASTVSSYVRARCTQPLVYRTVPGIVSWGVSCTQRAPPHTQLLEGDLGYRVPSLPQKTRFWILSVTLQLREDVPIRQVWCAPVALPSIVSQSYTSKIPLVHVGKRYAQRDSSCEKQSLVFVSRAFSVALQTQLFPIGFAVHNNCLKSPNEATNVGNCF